MGTILRHTYIYIYIYDDILMDIQSGVIKCGTTKENG